MPLPLGIPKYPFRRRVTAFDCGGRRSAGRWTVLTAFALCLSLVAGCGSGPPPAAPPAPPPGPPGPPPIPELVLERALPIDGVENFEPSGLVQYEGRLLTVSDKDDSTLYELDLGETSAVARPFRALSFAEEEGSLDFEGIALGADGELLLVSESKFRVLSVRADGGTSWLTPSLAETGRSAGLFQKENANFEAVVRLPDGRLLLGAERDPRGLVEVAFHGASAEARAWAMPGSAYPVPAGRGPDFADLTVAGDRVYALNRNAHLVVRLERGASEWVEREAWSYAKTENDPRFVFEDTSFGLGEGLVVDRFFVFVVIDANGTHRANDAADRRPLLFVFKRPA